MTNAPTEKETANHIAVNICPPNPARTPNGCKLVLIPAVKRPYITMTPIVAKAISNVET